MVNIRAFFLNPDKVNLQLLSTEEKWETYSFSCIYSAVKVLVLSQRVTWGYATVKNGACIGVLGQLSRCVHVTGSPVPHIDTKEGT